jgi:hypothetical protein
MIVRSSMLLSRLHETDNQDNSISFIRFIEDDVIIFICKFFFFFCSSNETMYDIELTIFIII